MKRIAFAVVTVMLGACAGAFCWAFFFLMNAGLDLLWVKAPAWLAAIGMPAVVYPLAFCVVGGVAIGLFQKNVGPYPDDMNTVLAEVKKTGRYGYRHLGAMFVGALLPLLFGGSIGPEAGLTGVVAGLCSWVGDRLKFVGAEMRELANAGTAAILSTIFSAPLFGLAAPLFGYADDADGRRHGGGASAATVVSAPQVSKPVKTAVYLLSVAGALGAFMLLNEVAGGGSGLPHFSAMAVGTSELAWALPVVALGACVVAGAILGVLGIFLPFTLFAGEAQTEMLAQQWTALGAGVLLATGFLKVLASQVCLGLGWRGGHFFPLIFSGIAIGYAAAGLFGIDPVFALSVSTAALLGAAMRQPLMVALLLILCFPAKAVVFVLAAACLGAAVPVPKAFSRV